MINQLPESKKPCIWMEAGVVQYKICNHCFDCTNCEFDQAMAAAAAQSLAIQRVGILGQEQEDKIRGWQQKMRQRTYEQLLEDQLECFTCPEKPRLNQVFNFQVPASIYLHRGHSWTMVETAGRVRIGLDDFVQKVLGPADHFELPEGGEELHRDTVALTLARQGQKAGVLAPVNGIVETVNPKVKQDPSLPHDDPYGEGWLFVLTPVNLKPDLEQMLYGQRNLAWIESESHKLLAMLESKAGITLPSGGMIIDDIYGNYPQLDWERLVQEFLRTPRHGFLSPCP